jgi:TolB-like protein
MLKRVAAGKPAIAMLPFADLTADPEQKYFGMVAGNL